MHINSDNIESLIKIAKLAYLYKEKFNKDFVIDYVCWRKYGHNEVDEPMFTQPNMYKIIKSKKDSIEIFKEFLLSKEIINNSFVENLEKKYTNLLNDELKKSKEFTYELPNILNKSYKGNKTLTHKWSSMKFPQNCKEDSTIKTGINSEDIKEFINASINLPKDFKAHQRLIQYFINTRKANLEKNKIDWATAEVTAFGSLLKDGFNCRISGQDVLRGTFSQRHLGLTDQETNEIYFPLKDKNNFVNIKGKFSINNSSLSEFAVMLFEYGYSLDNPKNFVIWEAQFGDFNNGAQVNN